MDVTGRLTSLKVGVNPRSPKVPRLVGKWLVNGGEMLSKLVGELVRKWLVNGGEMGRNRLVNQW